MISLFNLFINLVETFMTCYFSVRYLTINKKYKTLYMIVLWLIVFSEVTIANILESSFLIDTGLPIITIIIFLIIFTKEALLVKIIIPIFIYIILYICNLSSLSILALITSKSVNELIDSNIFPLAVIVSKCLFFIIGICVLKFRYRKRVNLDNKWLIFVPTCAMIVVIITNLFEVLFTGVVNYTLLYISLYALLGFSVFLYYLFLQIQKDSDNRTRQLLEIQQLQFHKENMDDIKRMNSEIRKIKHDMKHKIEYIQECLKDNKFEEVKEILDITYEDLNQINVIQFSDNETLNYILQAKNKIAEVQKVELNCEVNYKDSSIENNDLVVLLGNLLDNAIENSKEKDIVYLKINEMKGYLCIDISNPIKGKVIMDKTSKKDTINHGYGLKSVRALVEKYDGTMVQEEKDNYFHVNILLKMYH